MDTIKGKKFIKIFIANKMKKRNIKYENERVERNFPKNPNNISKEELHEHFDLNQDGKVTIEEYAEHINYHCDNPETLSDELDYERGFKYKEGGELNQYQTDTYKVGDTLKMLKTNWKVEKVNYHPT